MGKSQLKLVRKLLRPTVPLVARLLQNRFFLLFVSLSLLGYVVGRVQLPRPVPLPYDELFDNMHVYSYRDTPTDTISHFVVEPGGTSLGWIAATYSRSFAALAGMAVSAVAGPTSTLFWPGAVLLPPFWHW